MRPRISSSHFNTHPRTLASHTQCGIACSLPVGCTPSQHCFTLWRPCPGAHAHSCAYAPTRACPRALVYACAHTHMHPCKHAPMHSCIFAQSMANARSRCHRRASTYVRLRVRSCCCSLALPSVISGAWVLGRVPVHVLGPMSWHYAGNMRADVLADFHDGDAATRSL